LNYSAARACHTVTRWAPHTGDGVKRPRSVDKTRVNPNATKERARSRGSSLGRGSAGKGERSLKIFRLISSRLDVDERFDASRDRAGRTRTSNRLHQGDSSRRRIPLPRTQRAIAVTWDTWLASSSSNMDAWPGGDGQLHHRTEQRRTTLLTG